MKCLLITLILPVAIFSSVKAQDLRTQFFPKEEVVPQVIPSKKKVWVFIQAGQSNMAGRGLVEPQDTIPNNRILTINKAGKLIVAKEPLHFYEPNLTGLDCGYAFAKTLLSKIPDDVSILLIPTAVGGSSITQWLGDSLHRDVHLLSNFKQKVTIGMKYGKVKGILWHQGESDANTKNIPLHKLRLVELTSIFRTIVKNKKLPVLIGELGSYSDNPDNWRKINDQIAQFVSTDPFTRIVNTSDLVHKRDKIHFNSEGQRTLGERFAKAYLTTQ